MPPQGIPPQGPPPQGGPGHAAPPQPSQPFPGQPPQGPPPGAQPHPGHQQPYPNQPPQQAYAPQGPPPGQYPPPGQPQQAAGQPGPGQQQPPQDPQFPLGRGSLLNIHTGFFPLAFILFLTGPSIVIDGIEVGRAWGNLSFELAPGVHTIHIHTRYLWAVGPADEQIQIAPGQQLNISYETPFWMFSKGKMTIS